LASIGNRTTGKTTATMEERKTPKWFGAPSGKKRVGKQEQLGRKVGLGGKRVYRNFLRNYLQLKERERRRKKALATQRWTKRRRAKVSDNPYAEKKSEKAILDPDIWGKAHPKKKKMRKV